MPEQITSTANPTIKYLVRLHTRRERDRSGTFLIEGSRELQRAVAAEVSLEMLVTCPDLLDEGRRAMAGTLSAAGVPVVETSPAAFGKASHRSHPDGLLAVAHRFSTDLGRVPERGRDGGPPLLLVVESIEKPGNLGTMLRTAESAGADAVIVADATTDVFNPNVVRSSQGALFLIPVAVAGSAEVRSFLAARRIEVFAATPEGGRSPWRLDLTGPAAIAIGSEHAGLSPGWTADATLTTLPMAGASDSLNAAMAAGLLLYEAVRQRSNG